MKTDAQIIDALGGPAKVADLLGYESNIGTQRVHNWKVRGIPSKVRLRYLELFGKPFINDSTAVKEAK